MRKSTGSFLVAWRHALASQEGPQKSDDRHVALTLALYLDRDGLGAWPSQDTLSVRASLSDRTVCRALERLCAADWLSRQPRKARDKNGRQIPNGKRHKRWGYEYRAMLPKHLSAAYANGERRSLFTGEDPRKPSDPGNGERHDKRMANAVRTNSAMELSTKPMLIDKKDLPLHETLTEAAIKVRKRRAARDDWIREYETADQMQALRDRAKEKRAPLVALARSL